MSLQSEIDARNQSFWNEACGTTFAKRLGADANDGDSIARFDLEFFKFYPYVDDHIPFDDLMGRKVLEVGLGYGSVSQRLAKCSNFTGLDIAQGPVDWVNHRLKLHGLTGRAIQGSILDAPFADESFDAVITIGCLHHTGDFRKAVSEVHRLLRPGGRAVIMVYNATSYFRWLMHPGQTLKYVIRSPFSSEVMSLDEGSRARADVNSAGEAAPETVLQTKTVLRGILKCHFREVKISRENVSEHRILGAVVPRRITAPLIGPWFGLDLYATAIK